MVMPGEEQKNRRHVITINGLPVNTFVAAEVGTTVADRAIASEDVPVVLVVEHGLPLPGWKDRGTFLDVDEGVTFSVMANQMVPPRTLGMFAYKHGGYDVITEEPAGDLVDSAPMDLAAGDMVDAQSGDDPADPALMENDPDGLLDDDPAGDSASDS